MCSCNHCCIRKAIGITYSECVSVALRFTEGITHVPFCHLCPVQLCHVFPHRLISGMMLEECYWTWNVCFDFLYTLSDKFFILRRTEQDTVINVYWYSCEVPVILVGFYWHLIFQQIFEKYSSNYHENPSIGSWIVSCRWKDRHN
jgi:hypothetical protein